MTIQLYKKLHPCLAISRQVFFVLLAMLANQCIAEAGIVVIGHAQLPKLDKMTVQKIFTGRIVELNGVGITAMNASTGTEMRNRFLAHYLQQDEEHYVAYWIVRRYIGKGIPPKELPTNEQIIEFVQTTPGAVSYIEETALAPGINVLLRP